MQRHLLLWRGYCMEGPEKRQNADHREVPRRRRGGERRSGPRRRWVVSHLAIANLLGVDRTLVSKVINGSDARVSQKTYALIMAKAIELGGAHIEKRMPRSERIAVEWPVSFFVSLSDSGKVLYNGAGIITNVSYAGCRIAINEGENIAIPVARCIVDIFFQKSDGRESQDGIFGIPRVQADGSGTFGVQLTGYLGKGFTRLRVHLAAQGITQRPQLPSLSKRMTGEVQKIHVPSVFTIPDPLPKPVDCFTSTEYCSLWHDLVERQKNGLDSRQKGVIIAVRRLCYKHCTEQVLNKQKKYREWLRIVPELIERVKAELSTNV